MKQKKPRVMSSIIKRDPDAIIVLVFLIVLISASSAVYGGNVILVMV